MHCNLWYHSQTLHQCMAINVKSTAGGDEHLRQLNSSSNNSSKMISITSSTLTENTRSLHRRSTPVQKIRFAVFTIQINWKFRSCRQHRFGL